MLELFILGGLIISTVYFVLSPFIHRSVRQDIDFSANPHRKLLHQQSTLNSMFEELQFDHLTGKIDHEDLEVLAEEYRNQQRDLDNHIKNLGGVSRSDLVEQLEAEISHYQTKSSQSKELICPECGYQRKVHDKFCSNCGIKVNRSSPR